MNVVPRRMQPDETASGVRPFLRWAGSKRKLVPVLREYWSTGFSRYIEPFAGSSCLFFALKPSAGVLSDKNAELISTYEAVRDHPFVVHRVFSAMPRTKATYYRQRALDPETLEPIDRAARFIFLNRNCFNGIYRTNLQGKFNVPFSAVGAGAYPTAGDFSRCAELLQRVTLRCCDFGSTVRLARAGDFVYMDPPYAVASRRVFREYGVKMFSPGDVPRLTDHLRAIDNRGAAFLVSYADSPEGHEIAEGWNLSTVAIRRNIAGFKSSRRFENELLITNLDI